MFESSLEDVQTPLPHSNRRTTRISSAPIQETDAPSSDGKALLASRSSSTWLRRISTISSLNDSPSSSSRPGTPSVSFSNHSNTPILPRVSGTPATLPPNKLVKRTSSHRALSSSYAQPGFGSGSTFRRPATSHQRSANLLQLALDESLEYPEPQLPVVTKATPSGNPVNRVWRPYLFSGFPKSSNVQPRKRHTSGTVRSRPIRTITKAPDHYPTLLLATAVMPRPSEDDLDDVEDRPFTSSSIQHEGQLNGVPRVPPEPRVSDDFGDGRRKARLSFSLGDVFNSNSSPTWKLSRSESLRKKKPAATMADTRNFSSPLPPPSTGSRREKIASKLQRRRNITDPTLFRPTRAAPQLDLTTSKGVMSFKENPSASSPLPPLGRLSGFDIDLPYGSPTYPPNPQRENRRPSQNLSLPSSSHMASPPTVSKSRPKRVSLANSEPASTLMSSDGDTRVFTSGDEDSMEFQSDTAYDSLATRATVSSNSGIRAKPIERIFDESTEAGVVSEKLVPLQTLIQGGSFSEVASKQSSDLSMIDAREEMSTPIRQSRPGDTVLLSTPEQARALVSDKDPSSSPPSIAETQVRVENVSNPPTSIDPMNDGDETWEWEMSPVEISSPQLPQNELPLLNTFTDPKRLSSVSQVSEQSSVGQDLRRQSLFDWSEQPRIGKENVDGVGSRPRTVHGKQGGDGRGSRAPGRRGPSALHLRSQSVPVNKDSSAESDPTYPTTKYSTWGLGNKGVSEEWSDDFEFDEPQEGVPGSPSEVPTSIGSPVGLEVPRSIIERQASVHGQFGQVTELTLLVEELKRLRMTANTLGIGNGPSRSLWEEADGIINLATLDDEENELLPPRSPSSPSFSYDPFEDESPPANKTKNFLPDEKPTHRNSVSRRSMSNPTTPPIGRTRGESSAQAKSVLQTIYQNREALESLAREHEVQVPKKLPFDTQDLRNLVIRAGVVARALKAIVSKAEGVTHSPDRPSRHEAENSNSRRDEDIDDSPLRRIFSPPQSPAKKIGLPKSRSANSYLSGSPNGSGESELAGHLKMMTVV